MLKLSSSIFYNFNIVILSSNTEVTQWTPPCQGISKFTCESDDEGALNEVIPQSPDHSTEVHYNTMRVE